MKRAKHTLSNYRMVTQNMGQLAPIGCVPVLPGDTVQHHTSALVRVSPLNTPVMHPVSVRIHHFFVPNRILWDGWEDFITGGDGQSAAPTIPTITTTAEKKSVLSYLGVPPIAGVDVNALPVYAVNKIFNEWYRDQDLVAERLDTDNTEMRISWEKDYFSTARPWSQKGPQVGLPVGGQAPVSGIGLRQGNTIQASIPVKDPVEGDTTWPFSTGAYDTFDTDSDIFVRSLTQPEGTPDIYADLSQASAGNVNDWRAAFSLQRYQEARARYGSRFTEYLRYLGINPSDARLQRPEFLAGGSTRLNFSEVLQTANDPGATGQGREDYGVGDMYGHGIAGIRSNKYRKFFEEHGYIISMLSVRPKSLYMNGIPREFLKETKEDYYQKELVNLGQQEVWQSELYAEATKDVFGYQDRYHEYRSGPPSQVSQDFRDTLNPYHMARELAADPVLNESFVTCTPSDRIFQVGESVADTLWIMANHHIVARRLVPKRANPRII